MSTIGQQIAYDDSKTYGPTSHWEILNLLADQTRWRTCEWITNRIEILSREGSARPRLRELVDMAFIEMGQTRALNENQKPVVSYRILPKGRAIVALGNKGRYCLRHLGSVRSTFYEHKAYEMSEFKRQWRDRTHEVMTREAQQILERMT